MASASGTIASVPPLAAALGRALKADGVAFWAASDRGSMWLAWASGFSAPQGVSAQDWKKTLQTSVMRCATGRNALRVTPKNGTIPRELVFVPVLEGGSLLGVGGFSGGAELVEACGSHREILLESLPVLAKAIRSPAGDGQPDLSVLALGLVGSRGKTDAARAAADALQAALGAKRVSLLERVRGKWRLLGCSGVRAIDARGAATKEIIAAFEKAASGENIVGTLGNPLARWHDDYSARHVGLLAEGPWGSAQESTMRTAAPLVAHALHARRTTWQRLWPEAEDDSPAARRKARLARTVSAAVAGAAGIFLLWPFPQTFKGQCELVPSQRGAAVAEIGGRIDEVLVSEGDKVTAGQPVARIDAGEIRAQLEAARQTEAKAAAEARDQQQRDEIGAFRQAQLEQKRAAEEARKLALDLEQCTVRAPIDGIVLTKDLALRRGEVAQPGTVICEIAALSGWDLRIKLDESDTGSLQRALQRADSLPVRYVLQARSDVALEGTIDSPRQISQMVYPEEKGSFIYVTLRGIGLPEVLRADVRPGFSGMAKIQGPRRPLLLSVVSRLWHEARLHLFL
jgi:biotin carboxyl carrier protein